MDVTKEYIQNNGLLGYTLWKNVWDHIVYNHQNVEFGIVEPGQLKLDDFVTNEK